jgi:tRNA(His) 5'-end guanylyltransferase
MFAPLVAPQAPNRSRPHPSDPIILPNTNLILRIDGSSRHRLQL